VPRTGFELAANLGIPSIRRHSIACII
jgi:hypothetical protein